MNPNKKKSLVSILVAVVIIVIIIVGAIFFSVRQTGQAVNITGTPLLKPVDLLTENEAVISPLPKVDIKQALIVLPNPITSSSKNKGTEINFTLFKIDTNTYGFKIDQTKDVLEVKGILDLTSGEDSSVVHLNFKDSLPDLLVHYKDNEVTLKNLHFLSPDSSIIKFSQGGKEYPHIIKLRKGEQLNGTITASSIVPPILNTTLGSFLSKPKTDLVKNLTTAEFTYTAPQKSMAQTLTITANVSNQLTHSYYTLAIGDVVYALNESNYPQMIMHTNGSLNIKLAATTDLQPIAVPCEVAQLQSAIKNKPIKRFYSYNETKREPLVLIKSKPSDFAEILPFRGYFVELEKAQETMVSVKCAPKSFLPVTSIPDLKEGKFQEAKLQPGWQLISIPGTVPRSLKDFRVDTSLFEVYTCSQGYQCGKIASDSQLNPGKPYWIYVSGRDVIKYKYQLK